MIQNKIMSFPLKQRIRIFCSDECVDTIDYFFVCPFSIGMLPQFDGSLFSTTILDAEVEIAERVLSTVIPRSSWIYSERSWLARLYLMRCVRDGTTAAVSELRSLGDGLFDMEPGEGMSTIPRDMVVTLAECFHCSCLVASERVCSWSRCCRWLLVCRCVPKGLGGIHDFASPVG